MYPWGTGLCWPFNQVVFIHRWCLACLEQAWHVLLNLTKKQTYKVHIHSIDGRYMDLGMHIFCAYWMEQLLRALCFIAGTAANIGWHLHWDNWLANRVTGITTGLTTVTTFMCKYEKK